MKQVARRRVTVDRWAWCCSEPTRRRIHLSTMRKRTSDTLDALCGYESDSLILMVVFVAFG